MAAGARLIAIPPLFLPKTVDHKYVRETVRGFINNDARRALAEIEKGRVAELIAIKERGASLIKRADGGQNTFPLSSKSARDGPQSGYGCTFARAHPLCSSTRSTSAPAPVSGAPSARDGPQSRGDTSP